MAHRLRTTVLDEFCFGSVQLSMGVYTAKGHQAGVVSIQRLFPVPWCYGGDLVKCY